ncbi:CCA tRNA nucleotidyltransferase [Clostridium sp. NSJ-49]|uniref:CCA tRNA nucleotidyltransferase n=1 Tax=Clostridium TaxID=1485 RepID=UPI00164B4626|nr:CCA tRNA nucleotidyltransferase [Clostridium sp. NSJ-49]MBC5624114.1 CCA tRNA nucleotidyltransferase [Clostridium sp. NSJ-49]
MNINIPKNVKYIIDTFYQNNYEAYMVGGCVRDSLLGLSPKDYDITTSATPNITENLFSKTIPTGIEHGTITVVIEKENFEVTTYRTEGKYVDNRRPESVHFVSNLKEDLSRRDFTINAFAYNDKAGLVDYFGGLNDLNNKIIKAVGDPNIRFQEDALRMLRAIRFSAQLNFTIETNTLNAIKGNCNLIKNISIERIRDELCKLLISDNPSKGLILLRDTGILELVLPEINSLVQYTPLCNNHNRDVFEHTLKVINNTESDLLLRLSALFHDVGKLNTLVALPNGHHYFPEHNIESANMTKDILKRLKFDNETIDRVCAIIYDHLVLMPSYMPTDGEIKRLLNRVGPKNIFILFELQRADINSLWDPVPFLTKVDYISNKTKEILENKEPLTIKDLDIDGSILIKELDLKPGKVLGDILNYLLEKVLDDKNLNSKDKLINLSKSYLNNLNDSH